MTDSEGSFSSPNHPGSYPPNLLCVWMIRVPPPSSVQIHVSSLTVEGPSPCLFDWLEVQEQIEQSSVVTRSVRPQLPPRFKSNTVRHNNTVLHQMFFHTIMPRLMLLLQEDLELYKVLVACRLLCCTHCHSGEE